MSIHTDNLPLALSVITRVLASEEVAENGETLFFRVYVKRLKKTTRNKQKHEPFASRTSVIKNFLDQSIQSSIPLELDYKS